MKVAPYTATDGTEVAIEYEEQNNRWAGVLDDERIYAETLLKLKEKIDRRLTPKAKSRKIPAFVMEYSTGEPKHCHATSITDRGGYIRITYANGDRKQVSRGYLYADTPANRKLASEIGALYEQMGVLHKKRSALVKGLTPFDTKPLEDE